MTPEKGQQDGQGTGKHGVQGEAGRTGPVQLGEEKAKGRPYCYLQLLHRKRQKVMPESCQRCTMKGQEVTQKWKHEKFQLLREGGGTWNYHDGG